MKSANFILLGLGLVLYIGLPSTNYAFTPNDMPRDSTNNHKFLIENSDFIVSGEVKKIQYESFPSQIGMAVPTTLITYKVDRVFHGNIKVNSFVRLRFLGGPVEDGSTLQIPLIPKFEQSDYDVLFVSGNGTGPCPLVNCLEGRIRVKNGLLFNEALWIDRVALTMDGTTLYPAVEPIVPSDYHAFDEYANKLVDVIASGQLTLKSPTTVVLDARTVEYTP